MRFIVIIFCLNASLGVAQIGSKIDTSKRPSQLMQFMFRAEADNQYKNAQNELVPVRQRLRMRARYGLAYQVFQELKMGVQFRTGYANNPQDPQITLGSNPNLQGSIPVRIERLYAVIKKRRSQIVFGKNYYPFKKYHEMYWSDWINPTGISYNQEIMDVMEFRALFSVIQSNGLSFDQDAIFFGIQLPFEFEDAETKLKIEHNQTLHYFNNIPILPLELGSGTYSPLFYYPSVKLIQPIRGGEFYVLGEAFLELKRLSVMDSLLAQADDERTGGMLKVGYEHDTKRSHYEMSLNYTYMPRFAAIDYFAQNDWARWNYSGQGSPKANLTNIQGVELVFKYHINEKTNILFKYFNASRITKTGPNRESNDRFRIDFNVKI